MQSRVQEQKRPTWSLWIMKNALSWLCQVTENCFGQSTEAIPAMISHKAANSLTWANIIYVNFIFSSSLAESAFKYKSHWFGGRNPRSPLLWCVDIFTHPTNEETSESLGLPWWLFPESRPRVKLERVWFKIPASPPAYLPSFFINPNF